ncbi:unnamed protein product [Diplocarpon coronariae]
MAVVSQESGLFHVKRVAVIGAGPCGLATAKYLVAENAFSTIEVYEQQAEVGGVWRYTPSLAERVPVPQTTPWVPLERPSWPKEAPAPIFSNAMYEKLNTNIPKRLMQYSDQDFPSESTLFPSRQDVQSYLVKYSQDIRHLISFSTQVEDVSHTQKDGQEIWTIIAKSTITGEQKTKKYNAVVVANGHYSVPWIPSVPGMRDFNAAYPSVISHSKIYRSPSNFKGKKVVIIGNNASGLDISVQISPVCKQPLLNSISSPPAFTTPVNDRVEEVSKIVEYIVEGRAVKFEGGRIEKNIDAIVYATGYLYSFPFLKSMDPPLVTTGRRTIGLYQQIFHIAHPTLAFSALGQKIIPFPVSEGQAAAMAKVWSNNLPLPSKSEMEAWENSRVEELGDGTEFHAFGYPNDAAYINFLHDWTKEARNGFAKVPPFWDQKLCKQREVYAEIRNRFTAGGNRAKTLEELGFDFDVSEAKL